MRTSQHSGREGSARHNDRDFDTTKAANIDTARTNQNRTWCIYKGMSFTDAERTYYNKTYGAGLEARNERYRHEGHADRCKTPDDLYTGKLTRPEEMILQIGDRHADIDPQTFTACINDYLRALNRWNREHGGVMQILDVAIHLDETSPHAHIRRVWNYRDRDGNIVLGQNKALERAGVALPDPDKASGRYNNRKMTFDAWARGQWQEIAKAHGYEIETEAIKGRRHMKTADYARQDAAEALRQRDEAQAQAEHATETAQRARQDAEQANAERLQALRDRDAEQAKTDVVATLGKLQGQLRADPAGLPEPLKTLPAREKGLFRAAQPERVVLPAEDYEAASEALTALQKGEDVAASMDSSARKMTAAAREMRRNRMDAHDVAVNDRVRAAEDRADGLERTLDDTRRQLAQVKAERDEARQDLDEARDAAQQMQELQRLFPDTFLKMDRQRRRRALEYAYDHRAPHDPPVFEGKAVRMRWLLKQYTAECEQTGRQPRQDMMEHLARIERNRGIER